MQEEISKIFAVRLSAAISERNLPKKKIAEMAGIHPVTISKYLAGNRVPASEELHNLASVLRVNTSWLLGSTENKTPGNLADVLAMEESNQSEESTLREDPVSYKVPGLDATSGYRETILSLLPNFSTEQLADLAESLQASKPPGYVLILDQVLPMLRERIPNKENQ